MLAFDKPTIVGQMADNLFPSQIEIDYHAYRLAVGRFFKLCKKEKVSLDYFNENYYSENGIAWCIHRGVRYFTILVNQGTGMEERYYGRQIVFLNL